jgi:ArsR family transcriptional regulator, arsenate/arsenite/antimonite-responsive transcriptional repressor
MEDSLSTTSGAVSRTRGTKPVAKVALPALGVSEATLRALAEVFQMLADPSRLRILVTLARSGEMHVSALCQVLGQLQPAVSHHLSLLRSRKLVTCRRDGKNKFYAVDSALVRTLLEEFFGEAGNGQQQIQLDGFSLAFKQS